MKGYAHGTVLMSNLAKDTQAEAKVLQNAMISLESSYEWTIKCIDGIYVSPSNRPMIIGSAVLYCGRKAKGASSEELERLIDKLRPSAVSDARTTRQ